MSATPSGERRRPAVAASTSGPEPVRVTVRPAEPQARRVPQRPDLRIAPTTPTAAATPASPAKRADGAPIAAFLDLEEDFRRAGDLDALRTALVTGARRLVDYDCALLLERQPPLGAEARARWIVTAASGVSGVARRAPLVAAFERLVAELARDGEADLAQAQETVLDADEAGADLRAFTGGFPHLLWTPLRRPDGELLGALAAFRAEAWTVPGKTLLASLAGPWSHAHAALSDRGGSWRRLIAPFLGRTRLGLAGLAVAVLVLAFPVRFSVLAPAEVVGAGAAVVTAPSEGVVREIFVEPGDRVEAGTALFALVDTRARNDLEIAEKARAVASAKYRRAVQGAVANHGDGREIAVAKADLDVAEAELTLARDMHERTRIAAPRAGVVVYSNRSDWVGRPVATGDRVMEVVDPTALELRIELGLADTTALRTGTPVRLFLDGDPLAPLSATVGRIGFRPVADAERRLVHRIFADFDEGAAPRLGARGTARIDGERVTLGYYLFRRPIAALRQKLGV